MLISCFSISTPETPPAVMVLSPPPAKGSPILFHFLNYLVNDYPIHKVF